MHIINDFFLLCWREDATQMFSSIGDIDGFLTSVLKSNYDDFCDYTSILLIVSPSNIEKIGELKDAKNAMKTLVGLNEWDKKRVQYIQKELLFFLNSQGNLKLNKQIQKNFDKLRKENIIGYDISRQLISLLTLIEKKKETIAPIHIIKARSGSNFYDSATNSLCTAIENLKHGVEDKILNEYLSLIPKKLRDEKFSIGVTGVMNAGKSTLLNALLGKEILGTSVIPETANLSIIKYAKKPSAKVNFWTKEEWANIEKSALSLENVKPFIKETKEHFKNTLDEFITRDGVSKEIDIASLPSFTSAQHSDKKCNLVKSVELYTDLKFVENGVEIVDTPGLDDPVMQREEITKNYLYRCDLMMHLMNVNQSATQKDIEFITDTLLYQNVVRLLIVITRIDTVSKTELEEVIEFTKTSIKAKLQTLNKESQFNSIIEKIDFIPIAGQMALMHRTGKAEEAIKEGYSLEKTGILEIEEYLSDVLFGTNSQKAKLVVDANKKELLNIAKSAKNYLHVEKNLLGKSSSEIENEFRKYQEEMIDIKNNITKLTKQIEDSKEELISYFPTLSNLSKNKLLALKALIKRRVVDDVSYELRKNKAAPKESRISYMIETGIKDGLIELLRDYKYQFQKKMENEFEKISKDFEDFSKNENIITEAKTFFKKHFSDLNVIDSNSILIKQVNKSIKTHSKKDFEGFNLILDEQFIEAFDDIYDKFSTKLQNINKDLVAMFEFTCKEPLKQVESEMNNKEQSIKKAQSRIKDKSFDTTNRLGEIEQKLLLIDKVVEQLSLVGVEI